MNAPGRRATLREAAPNILAGPSDEDEDQGG